MGKPLAIWVLVNDVGIMSEDTAYLIGRMAPRFAEIRLSVVPERAEVLPDIPGAVDVIYNRARDCQPAFWEALAARGAAMGVPVTNPGGPALRAQDKRSYPEDYPDLIPPTRIVGSLEAFRAAREDFGGDVVIKEPFGRKGEQVLRVSSPAEEAKATDLLAASRKGEIVVQPFFSGFAEGDKRIICARDRDGRHRPIAGFTRKPPPGAWRCNISRGGSCVIEDLKPEEERLASEVAERSGLDIAVLDFGWHQGRLYLIETSQNGGGYIDFDLGNRANCGDQVAQFLEALALNGR